MLNRTPFIDSRLQIQWIETINGWGIFATDEISAGETIECAPVIIYPTKIMNMGMWLLQAEGMKSHEFVIDRYTLTWGDNAAIALGWCGLYNHSDNNNATFKASIQADCIEIHTIKSISKGEQCTVHYGPHWFNEKGYITKVDFLS